MENVRFAYSLRWKILGWFFLNLLVVGAIVFFFLRIQFRVGIGSLLGGAASDRLEALAQPLAAELRKQPLSGWNAALSQSVAPWRKRGVHAALFRSNGTYLAGDIEQLPSEVARALESYDHHKFSRPPPRGGGGGFRSSGPARSPLDELLDNGLGEDPGRMEPPFSNNRLPGLGGPGLPQSQEQSSEAPFEKFMLVDGNPRMYWAGVQLGEVYPPERGGPPPFVTLVLASDSLRGGGLFFDYVPWLLVGGCAALVSILLWLPFVHHLTRALNAMTQDAEDIAQGRFDAPRASKRRDEIGRLGRALGHMAGQLENVLTGQKRFLGDTAHELLSPLARLEVVLSIIEQRAGDSDDKRYTTKALSEVRHISSLVHELLSFTKASLRNQPPELHPVFLEEFVREAVEREAAGTNVSIEVSEYCYVMAAPDLLARAIGNGIRNAVRYAGRFGPIEVSAQPAGENHEGVGMVALNIIDHGPGVPPAALDRLFDPFFRPAADRARESGGVGLGLAIVKTCIEACGGHASVSNREPSGLKLTFTLQSAG